MATGKKMDTNKKMRDYISAFADGELPDADLELALAALREADGREAWRLYHEIGDALRAEPAASSLSPGFAERRALDLACLQQVAQEKASHDHLFHTVLSLLDVRTQVHEASLDLTARCRPAG